MDKKITETQKKTMIRVEGGIEPLSYYTSTDLKSAHLTREDHPRIFNVLILIDSGRI